MIRACLAVVLLLLAGCTSPAPSATSSTQETSPPSSSITYVPFPKEHSRFYKTPLELRLNWSFVERYDLYHRHLQLEPNVSVVATYDLQVNLNQSVHLRLNWTAQDWRHYPPDVEGVEFTPSTHEWNLQPGWANLTVQVTIKTTHAHHGRNVTIAPNMETVPIKFPKREQGFLATLL